MVLVVFLFLLTASVSSASTALLLEEPFGLFGAINPTGHAAIYLDHVCAETVTSLRPCQPGEAGVVISRYHRIDGFDWVAIPLIPYLYAVETLDQVPATATPTLQRELRDQYRRRHLEHIAPDRADGSAPGGEWIQLVGSAYDRKLYGFQLGSTPEQDAALISAFNDSKNVSHFNLLFRNCADFSRKLINRQYPGAIHRNFIADFGLTTPKQVARSIVRYANANPEVEYDTFVIPQVPGTIKRSHHVDGVAESLVRSKKYVIPLAVLAPITTVGIAAAWLANGHLALPQDDDNLAILDHPTHGRFQLLRRHMDVTPATTTELLSNPAADDIAEAPTAHTDETINPTALPTLITMPTADDSAAPIVLQHAE
jgi:hypothetical protein